MVKRYGVKGFGYGIKLPIHAVNACRSANSECVNNSQNSCYGVDLLITSGRQINAVLNNWPIFI